MLLALVLASLTVLGDVLIAPQPAEAAATPGAGGYWTPAGGWLGNYIVGGQRVYCIDLLTDTVGSGGTGTVSDAITEAGHGTRPVSGIELRKLNYAVSVWGQTSDTIRAAAVSAYVYNFTSANHYGNGPHYITGPHAAAILAEYRRVEADTNANYNQGGGAGTGTLQLDVDPTNHYLGTLRVTGLSPSNATGSVTLVNGVFADTRSATRDGVSNNSSFPVIGIPPQDGSHYRIKAEGAFRGDGKRIYESSLTIYSEGAMQRTAGPGQSRPGVTSFSLVGQDTVDRTSQFRPIVGTKVAAKFVAQGEEFSDVLTFSTSPDEGGLHNPWYQHPQLGYAQVRATGTLFGPFLAQPEESDRAPQNAPVVVQEVSIETSASEGPNIDYTVPSGATADEAGFYTWVWSITSDQQTPATRAFLPKAYDYSDRFGQMIETSISPTSLHISTAVSASEAGIGESVVDEVTVGVLDGGWLQVDGSRVPATLTGTAYFTETEPTLSETAPPEAQVVGNFSLVTNQPGTSKSESMKLPLREGYVSFQWCILTREQPVELRGLLREGCDMYGQASETVRVVVPQVTTEAVPYATVHDGITDTAIVSGRVSDDLHLKFELYKQPVAGDLRPFAGVAGAESRWGEDEVLALAGAAVCVPDNLAHTTESIPLESGMQEAARYLSPPVRVSTEGTYWWIERVVHIDSDTGHETVVSSGECGLPNETTHVKRPSVATKAVALAAPGTEVHDIAEVTGPIPGPESGLRTELTFEVFRNTAGTESCVPSNLVYSLDDPVLVTGAGSYRSTSIRIEEPGEYFWVETLAYVDAAENREVVHVGACALPAETTKVVAELPNTGSSDFRAGAGLIVFASLLIGLGALLLIGARLRRARLKRY